MSFKCMLNFTINLPCFFALLESATFFLDFMFIFFHFPLYVRFLLLQCLADPREFLELFSAPPLMG